MPLRHQIMATETGTLSATPTSEEMRHRFGQMQQTFDAAGKAYGLHEFDFELAGRVFRLRFAGLGMIDQVWPALSHLAVSAPGSARADLTVMIWDHASTGVELPATVSSPVSNTPTVRPIYYTSELVLFDELGSAVSFLDNRRSVAIYCTEDAEALPAWDRASPLRHIINWWMQTQELQVIHSAAVGREEGVVLLAGKGGSGKSTTALACLREGLAYLGDDYVVLRAASPRAYALYGSAKLEALHFAQHAWLLPGAAPVVPEDEKVLGFVDGAYLKQLAGGLPIVAVVLPQVIGHGETCFRTTSPAHALFALAPSTLLQLRSGAPTTLEALTSLVLQVPSFVLELGEDVGASPAVVLSLLDQLGVA